MDKFKEMLQDRCLIKMSFFILFNVVLLYVIFSIIKNISPIYMYVSHGIYILIDVFRPLIIGLVLAYLLNPLAEFIDSKLMSKVFKLSDDPVKSEKKRNLAHFVSVIITFLLVIAAIIAIIYGFAIMIMGQIVFHDFPTLIQDLLAGIVRYENEFRVWISENVPMGILSDKFMEFANVVMIWVNKNINASSVITFFSNIGGSMLDILIGIIFSIYLMKDKRFFLGLWRKFRHLIIPQKSNAVLTEILSEVNDIMSKFIRGALLDAVFVAVLSSLGLSIMGLEAAVFIGIFAGICNIIPYFGPVMGMVPAFFMGICTDGVLKGMIAALILFVVQQIDSNIIYPRIVGTSTGLHPLMVLLAVSVFGYFAGILGMLLAVPLAGIIQVFVIKWAENKNIKVQKKASSNTDKYI